MEIISIKELEGVEIDQFTYYDLLESREIYPGRLSSAWLTYNNHKDHSSLMILRPVSENSFNKLYNHYLNPISLKILINYVYVGKKYIQKGSRLLCSVHSIDDTCYQIEFIDEDSKLESIRMEFISYVESNPVIDVDEWIKFGVSLGGTDTSY